jgi:hypothetical protein
MSKRTMHTALTLLASLGAASIGTKLIRHVTLTGDTLKLRPAEPREGILEYTLTWERVAPAVKTK